MIDDRTLTPGRSPVVEPPPNVDRPLAAARSAWRPPLRFPPRLEISPLTMRRPTGCADERLPVH